jgi:hypothetical protein
MLDEAMAEAREGLWHSPAWAYLEQRGVQRYTALVYTSRICRLGME